MDIAITLQSKNDQQYLQFDFPDHLDEAMATEAIKIWKHEMSRYASPTSKINLIFNCSSMRGFDTQARRNWQAAMKEMKPQIGSIWIVCDNVFILGAAKTMGVLTNFNIKTVRSLEEIK